MTVAPLAEAEEGATVTKTDTTTETEMNGKSAEAGEAAMMMMKARAKIVAAGEAVMTMMTTGMSLARIADLAAVSLQSVVPQSERAPKRPLGRNPKDKWK